MMGGFKVPAWVWAVIALIVLSAGTDWLTEGFRWGWRGLTEFIEDSGDLVIDGLEGFTEDEADPPGIVIPLAPQSE